MSSPTGRPPGPARWPGGTSRRGLSLFRTGPAVLPQRRQCGLGWRRRWGRVRHWVTGGGGPFCRVARGLWGRRARAQHVHHRPGGLGRRPSSRPRGGPPPRWCVAAQGRSNAAKNFWERRWGSLGGGLAASWAPPRPPLALLPPPLGGAPMSSARAESAGGGGLGLLPPPPLVGAIGGLWPTHQLLCATPPPGPPD